VEITLDIVEDGVMQIAEMMKMKPKLRKIGRLWVCYTEWEDTITCTGKSPEHAYSRWLVKNQLQIEQSR
jgi:hypothetical protein